MSGNRAHALESKVYAYASAACAHESHVLHHVCTCYIMCARATSCVHVLHHVRTCYIMCARATSCVHVLHHVCIRTHKIAKMGLVGVACLLYVGQKSPAPAARSDAITGYNAMTHNDFRRKSCRRFCKKNIPSILSTVFPTN